MLNVLIVVNLNGHIMSVGHADTMANVKLLKRLTFKPTIIFATINVIGGYFVTDRMLKMFKKKK